MLCVRRMLVCVFCANGRYAKLQYQEVLFINIISQYLALTVFGVGVVRYHAVKHNLKVSSDTNLKSANYRYFPWI